jgi:hypothetical protein
MLNAHIGAVDDRMRQAATTIYQVLSEPELTAVIAAARTSCRMPGPGSGTGTTPRRWTGNLELRILNLQAGRPVAVRGSSWRPICTARRCARSTTMVNAWGADTGIGKSEVTPPWVGGSEPHQVPKAVSRLGKPDLSVVQCAAY